MTLSSQPTVDEIRRATIRKIAWAAEHAADGHARDRALGMARLAADVLDLGMTEYDVLTRIDSARDAIGAARLHVHPGDARERARAKRGAWEDQIVDRYLAEL